MTPTLILINPWIYDFAAYDLWSRPLGLLYLARHLAQLGHKIQLIDCMDVHHPGMRQGASKRFPKRRLYGTGKFMRQKVPRPGPLRDIPRSYSRYGISPRAFIEELKEAGHPVAVLVTSIMTYWYPGVQEVIGIAKEVHPGVPVILGGMYGRLCKEHAVQNAGADLVVTGNDLSSLWQHLQALGISLPGTTPGREGPLYPAFELQRQIDYVCLLTSQGCPYGCQYCASHFLWPEFKQREPGEIMEEIRYWHANFGVRDFAFYDDALLVASETHLMPLLEDLARTDLELRFHTPNALHVRELTGEIAALMHRTGFKTIRLGLETSDFSSRRFYDQKVSAGEFERAVGNLLRAGFAHHEIGAYILTGLPGQSVKSVMESIEFVGKTGAVPYLSEYSPIPHTALWETAVRESEYDIASEPLFHNNSLLPCWNASQRKEMSRLKGRVLEIREQYRKA